MRIDGAHMRIDGAIFDPAGAIGTTEETGYPVIGVFDRSAGSEEEIRRSANLYIRSFDEMEDNLNEKSSDHRGI